jgi:hypothetical protein
MADDNPADWSARTLLQQEDYFTRYLDRKTSPDDAKLEPGLQKLLTKLYDRQLTEAYGLIDKATARINPDGEDRAALKIHRQEFREDYLKQCRGFAAERDRYISDYQRANVMRGEQEQSRRESPERSIDPDKPKLTR